MLNIGLKYGIQKSEIKGRLSSSVRAEHEKRPNTYQQIIRFYHFDEYILHSHTMLHIIFIWLAGGGSVTTQLNEADMEIMGNAECAAVWGNEFRADVHICITSQGQDKGSCNVSVVSVYSRSYYPATYTLEYVTYQYEFI